LELEAMPEDVTTLPSGQEPTMWQLIFAVDPGIWLLAGLAAIAGIVVARVILVPQGAAREAGRAQSLALWRTWIVGLLPVGRELRNGRSCSRGPWLP
jgi:hypothetical protein